MEKAGHLRRTMSIRAADLTQLFPNVLADSAMEASATTAQAALNLLQAIGCDFDEYGHLHWLAPKSVQEFFQVEAIPLTLSALDALTLNGVSMALKENKPIQLNEPRGVEVRADAKRRILVLRKMGGQSTYLALPQPANDAGAIMLISALAEKRMCLFRQPIVCAQNSNVLRFECLSRLIHEDGRVAQPYEFIPAAERAGLVGALDLETLTLAFKALERDVHVNLAVNVSAATIADQGSRRAYKDMLAGHSGLATRLTVEITETIAIHDLDIAARFGHAAKASGARLALDDFGEGHTSFQSLRTLPFDEVKIDGLYIKGIDTRSDSRAFVVAIDRLARDLGMETVAERVETQEEALALRAIGVDGLQGYLYGKPRSAG
jgi:EAL domain-containing protein (putative c-di-GMP-specific phosphodiesterase class I)